MSFKHLRYVGILLILATVAACGQDTAPAPSETESKPRMGGIFGDIAGAPNEVQPARVRKPVNTSKWETQVIYEIGNKVTVVQEPGNEDTATSLVESIFEFPPSLVNLEGLTEGLVGGLDIDIQERLPVEEMIGGYRQAYLATERGKDIVFRLEVFAYQSDGRQHILMMAALPEKFDAQGGTGLLLKQFADGKSLSELTSASQKRRDILTEYPADHIVTTSSTGIPLTHGQMLLAVEVGDFLAGKKLTAANIKKLYDNADQEWERDPNEADYASVEAFMDEVRAAEPLKQLEAAGALYRESMKSYDPKDERSALMDIILEHNPILARKGDDLLSKRAVDARMRSAKIIMHLQGKNPRQIDAALPKLRKQTISSFPHLSDDERNVLMSAEIGWLKTVGRLANMSTGERENEVSQAKMHARGSSSVLDIAYHLERDTVLGGMSADQYNRWLEGMILGPSLITDLQNNRP